MLVVVALYDALMLRVRSLLFMMCFRCRRLGVVMLRCVAWCPVVDAHVTQQSVVQHAAFQFSNMAAAEYTMHATCLCLCMRAFCVDTCVYVRTHHDEHKSVDAGDDHRSARCRS